MTFGMPTLLETKTLADCTALCRELRLGFIELNMNLPQYQIEKIDIAAFAKIAAACWKQRRLMLSASRWAG
jgi:hypothetical protein